MFGQVRWCLRPAVSGGIGGAETGDAADLAEPDRHEAAVWQGADADGDVDGVGQKIDQPVGKRQPDVDLGEGVEERRDDGEDMETSENDRRRDHEAAPGRPIFTRRGPLGLAHVLEDTPAGGDIGLAGLGQGEVAVGPV